MKFLYQGLLRLTKIKLMSSLDKHIFRQVSVA
jgi:hypothetical protein